MYDIRIHVRHCLLYEFQMGHTAADATRNICTYVAPDALSHSMAKYWFQRFRHGDFNVEDKPRSGRPSTIDIRRLQILIQADPTRTTRSLANELETSHSTVERHLHELGMQFHVDRWVYIGAQTSSSNQTTNNSSISFEQAPTSSHTPSNTPADSISSSGSWIRPLNPAITTQSNQTISTIQQIQPSTSQNYTW